MIPVLLIILSLWGVNAANKTILHSPPLTDFGTWQEWSRCPDGEYVQGMQIKYERNQGDGDDTALNALKLFCQPIGDDGFRTDHSIMSGEGRYGEWQDIKWCPEGTVGIGFSLRSEPFQYKKDDVAADNFAMYCGTITGPSNKDSWVQGDTVQWGDWTSSQFCPEGYVFCGIQTQIEQESKREGKDQSSLNNVNVECCLACPNYEFMRILEFDNRQGAGTVKGKYTKRVSFSKTSSRSHKVSQEEKQAIIDKVSKSTGFSYEVPVKTGKIGGSARATIEHTSGTKTISSDELAKMVQDASTIERKEEATITVPAFTRVWIEQLVLICGDVRIELSKTVTSSDAN